MAGKIIADTIETGAGADISTSYVVNGSAKAWVNFNGSSSASNPNSIRVSLNCTSYTDNGSGDYTISLTNSMNATNGYSATVGSGSNRYASFQTDGDLATGSVTIRTQYDDGLYSDSQYTSFALHGDLA
jgi:hypothetical protein